VVYAGTGNNFTHPATEHSDAVVAFDMATGQIRWSRQLTKDDVWNNACISVTKANCPESAGPDSDIAVSPILATLPTGRQLILVGQKSGVVHALDPERNGAIVWQTRVSPGGINGGIQWGPAFDGRLVYAAVSDLGFEIGGPNAGSRGFRIDTTVGGGLHALEAATGSKVWSALPQPCATRTTCGPAQSAAVTAIPGVVFSGSIDGRMRGYAVADGKVIWEVDTAQPFDTVNGPTATGGSINGPGPTVANGMLYVVSGYGKPGVLLAFSVDGR
jgi:polyvinyl alcohol dehydrogenase (cytochrome)